MKSQNPHTEARCEGWNVHGSELSGPTKSRPKIQATEAQKARLQVLLWLRGLAVQHG
ncbi:hypothetical protein TMRH483_01686 [Qipengyuania sp. 483]